jgi:hypothetical protein
MLLASLALGCDGTTTPPISPAAGPVEEATTGRVVVAEVNGHPVFIDCVEARARANALSPQQALEECIDFELLAQAAEAGGYAAHPAARETRRRESARALIDQVFEREHQDPADIPRAALETLWARPPVHTRFNHPEYRFVYFARAQFAAKHADADKDARARAAMDELFRRARGKTLDSRFDFFELAEQIASEYPDASVLIERRPYNTPLKGRANPAFAEAAFAIPERGKVSPPTRTPWGWDVIYLAKIEPLARATLDEVEAEIREIAFAGWRRQQFLTWSNALMNQHDISIDARLVEQLAREGELAEGGAID